MDRKEYFAKYNISEVEFEQAGLCWEELMEIKEDYEQFKDELHGPAEYLVSRFLKAKKVHSVRYRIKDSNHLISKIIRKRIMDPKRLLTLENYRTDITDLIGIRILHLFKEDISHIHGFVTETWDLHETPTAYVRAGDPSEYRTGLEEFGCEVRDHPYGYRSVHYLIKTKPAKTEYVAEVQVRTIYEEAWSEIDHKIRYPFVAENRLLSQYLNILNSLSGNADVMSSHVQRLKKDLESTRVHERNLYDQVNRLKEQLQGAQSSATPVDFQQLLEQVAKIEEAIPAPNAKTRL